jgi:hypothetical protein
LAKGDKWGFGRLVQLWLRGMKRLILRFWLKPNRRFNKQTPAKAGGNLTRIQFNFNSARI